MSTVRSRPGYQPRKHSKTFTGCWTCRRRKVKCDEERPGCRQCRQKNLECQGYGVRLHWMTPETGLIGSNADLVPALPRAKSQRSQISIEPMKTILQGNEIDEILTSIDALDSRKDGSPSLFVDGFGVFHGAEARSPPHPISPINFDDRPVSVDSSDSDHFMEHVDPSDTLNFPDILPVAVFLDSLNPSELLGSESLAPFDFSTPCLNVEDFTAALGEPMDILVPQRSKKPTEILIPSPPRLHDDWQALSHTIPRSPVESPLSKQEQFLMSHYVNRVVRLFCVIDNAKSPWRTIHLPHALQSVGELTITGSTSRIQGALRNALLAISAFTLSNDNKHHNNEEVATKWANEASWFRCKAIKLLKDAVENDFYSVPKPKYKEFLATMLSMISINVMSGDLGTCGVHLDGAWRLMTHARNWKSKYSTKARALHRIYFYLRTIYESTAPRSFDTTACLEGGSPEETLPPETPRQATLPPTEDEAPVSTALVPGSVARMVTYECIYGVPQQLLILLTRSNHLVAQVAEARANTPGVLIPDHLANECDELETCIMDTQIEDELERFLPADHSIDSEIIRHQTKAFRNAVIIYFAQHIRLLSHRYLQPYVKAVLENVEAIEKIKTDTQTLAAPLYWPAFIAASEAFDLDIQDRFRKWYEHVELYGIEAMRTGIKVLTEVWKEGPPSASRRTSLWRMIAVRNGQHLMLT